MPCCGWPAQALLAATCLSGCAHGAWVAYASSTMDGSGKLYDYEFFLKRLPAKYSRTIEGDKNGTYSFLHCLEPRQHQLLT